MATDGFYCVLVDDKHFAWVKKNIGQALQFHQFLSFFLELILSMLTCTSCKLYRSFSAIRKLPHWVRLVSICFCVVSWVCEILCQGELPRIILAVRLKIDWGKPEIVWYYTIMTSWGFLKCQGGKDGRVEEKQRRKEMIKKKGWEIALTCNWCGWLFSFLSCDFCALSFRLLF